MRAKKHTPEQIVRKLREEDRPLSEIASRHPSPIARYSYRLIDTAASRLLFGSLAGAVATVFMSAVMIAAKRLGLMGEMPPEMITARLLDRVDWKSRSRLSQDLLSALLHMGFGGAAGALFALAERRPQPPVPTVPAGILFGSAVWLVSYQGWVPALRIMAPPSRDRPGRPQAMLAAHLVYGAVLGVVVGLYPAACKGTYSTINKGR